MKDEKNIFVVEIEADEIESTEQQLFDIVQLILTNQQELLKEPIR